jgi:hypothetical protein
MGQPGSITVPELAAQCRALGITGPVVALGGADYVAMIRAALLNEQIEAPLSGGLGKQIGWLTSAAKQAAGAITVRETRDELDSLAAGSDSVDLSLRCASPRALEYLQRCVLPDLGLSSILKPFGEGSPAMWALWVPSVHPAARRKILAAVQ